MSDNRDKEQGLGNESSAGAGGGAGAGLGVGTGTVASTHQRRTPAPPAGRLIDSPPFPAAAARLIGNQTLRANMRHATHTIRAKRAKVAAELPNWEQLRQAGAQIKDRLGRHLDYYLEQLEANLIANGAQVHWAADADEANRIIIELVKAQDVDEVVKIKSMVTQEIEMNEALEAAGIAAWETDLAELIVQLGHDRPSNILVPAIHRNRDEVREIFLREMKLYGKPAPEDLDNEPAHLAAAARAHLREKFLRAKVAISGANFCVADTGTLVIVESEGNGRMCLTLPDVLISVTGIEKLVPTVEDLEVMLQLLPRSSTGERMNPYTSMWTGVTPGDGPQEVHVVLLDNGRSRVLADPEGRAALRCIRCAACMHSCPVYERVGGHAYGSVYPGPIGAILSPQLRGINDAVDKSLPFASTLCGACAEVCPVKIPIPDILVHLRHRIVEEVKRKHLGLERFLMGVAGWAMARGRRFGRLGKLAGVARRLTGREYLRRLPGPAHNWTRARDLRMPPKQSFRSWWKKEHG
ncbi:MAG: iron-sulfur cluster-binding protein [Coriobacteriales bacterium]|jgi:L-lactate dehydrogenase complex protein LldF|nr:iron-sulfur cluster-binding protein [Coriobacteriales bacterium]